MKIVNEDSGSSKLVLDPAVASDAGLYKAVARNPLGETVTSVRVVLGDIPDSPESPVVEAMTDTDVLLSWRTPTRLNHSPVICYKVQMGYIGEHKVVLDEPSLSLSSFSETVCCLELIDRHARPLWQRRMEIEKSSA